jgi:hypothetical protein
MPATPVAEVAVALAPDSSDRRSIDPGHTSCWAADTGVTSMLGAVTLTLGIGISAADATATPAMTTPTVPAIMRAPTMAARLIRSGRGRSFCSSGSGGGESCSGKSA